MAETPDLVSVVIPVRNEAAFIQATIDSILRQDYAGNLEVVVADGMSTDGTREILDAICSRHDQIRYLDNPSGRTPSGLNIANTASEGDVLVRCDGHAELPVDYISTAVRVLAETGAVNVGGVQRAVGVTPMQRAIAYAMSSRVGVGDARFHYGGDAGPVDTVFLGVFRRAPLLDAGLFDEDLSRNQDYELNIRLRTAGGTVWFDPRLQVVYRPRRTLRKLARQYFEYGRWKRHVIGMHPESTRLRQLIPPLFLIGLAVSAVLGLAGLTIPSLLVPGTYLMLLLAATVIQLVKRGDLAALLFPAAVATMHVSWGLGFLTGTQSSKSER
jgi:glycosyltransferase involved in cell wall biosynthesis